MNQSILLMLIGCFGFYTCYQQNVQMKMMQGQGGFSNNPYGQGAASWGGDYDPGFYSSRGGAGGDESGGDEGFFARRRKQKLEKKQQSEKQKVETFDKEIDRILIKVKDKGMQSLTTREKKTLQEATDKSK